MQQFGSDPVKSGNRADIVDRSGRRVIEGQHIMQASSDIFLGSKVSMRLCQTGRHPYDLQQAAMLAVSFCHRITVGRLAQDNDVDDGRGWVP